MTIKKVGVLGCGLMGSGIAQVCAEAGFEVITREVEQKFLDNGLGIIEKNLSKAVQKEKISESDKKTIQGRIKGTLKLEDMKDCDLIIEAVIENLDLKNDMFSKLDNICPASTIFSSNTSSLSIMSMAVSTKRTDRFCGLHFFNPVPVMKLVEIVKTIATSKETIDACYDFVKKIKKTPILAKDKSGFIVNYLLVPYLLDGIRSLENGAASITDIDTGMMLGANHHMGPLTLNDFIGLDTMLNISKILYNEYHDSKYAAPPLLTKMVLAGYLGRKSGKGFYDYSGEKPVPSNLGI